MSKAPEAEDFGTLCKQAFSFLEREHSFHFETPDSVTARFRSPTTLIEFRDQFLGDIDVRIWKQPLNESKVWTGSRFYELAEILNERTGSGQPPIEGVPDLPLTQLSMEMQFQYFAGAIKRYAKDLIVGDFSLYEAMDKKKHGSVD